MIYGGKLMSKHKCLNIMKDLRGQILSLALPGISIKVNNAALM